jgi:DNA invertase Pin-like site-specific DNA recombinase
MTADGGLAAWAEASGRRRANGHARGELRFAFYGRVSTEDWQDPVTSRARQREQAEALVRGHGHIVAEFFDEGQSRSVAWGRRPQAAALVAQLTDPCQGWDAIVIGEYERAFCGSQYASMAPLFEHYGVQLWMPEAGGRVDFASEHDEQTMTMLGLSSKREVTRTSIRVRTAMAVQTREQGRYLGGRPPYGYRLGDAGPHPNKAHAAWGRRAHRLEPDQETAHVVRWIFAQRLDGHSVARIARALNEAGVPCPSASDPGRNQHRTGTGWTLGTVTTILQNPRYTGHQVWNRQRTDKDLADPADVSLGQKSVQRWNLPDGWVISKKPAHPGLSLGCTGRRPVPGRDAVALISALHVDVVSLVDEVGPPLAVDGDIVQQAERVLPDRLLTSVLRRAGDGFEPGHLVQQDLVLALDCLDGGDEPGLGLDYLRQQALGPLALLNVVPERLGQCLDVNRDSLVPVAGLLPDGPGQGFLQVDGRPAYAPAVLARSVESSAVG